MEPGGSTYTLGESACLFHADCRDALRALPDNCVDAVCTDPPYALVSVVKRFGGPNAAPAQYGKDGAFVRQSAGFMGKIWDNGEVAFDPGFWAEVLRVLKPGGHVVAMGGTRTYHHLAMAIEDAGFEIRDSLMWVYGTGFPKSQNVSAFIDKELGFEREVVGRRPDWVVSDKWRESEGRNDRPSGVLNITAPASPQAIEFDGFGTALKPAFEPIVLARKPLSEKTVAANVLKWRTGAINIGACRVPAAPDDAEKLAKNWDRETICDIRGGRTIGGVSGGLLCTSQGSDKGRWPANLVHSGEAEVVDAFPQSAGQLADARCDGAPKTGNIYGKMKHRDGEASADRTYEDQGSTNFTMKPGQRRNDSGSAARFFYSAKASKSDRAGSKHPTVKPVALMSWLCRLVTPPGGVVLDPFAGSGTTGAAALQNGFKCLLVEREAEYVADICRRLGSPPLVPHVV